MVAVSLIVAPPFADIRTQDPTGLSRPLPAGQVDATNGSNAPFRSVSLLDNGRSQTHSITSSARSSSDFGIVRPSDLAVFRLTTSSHFVGCATGRSTGFNPLRILST